MIRKPAKKEKHVPPGPCSDSFPHHLLSRRQASDSDTESIASGFFPVEANQEQNEIRGYNNNDELRSTDSQSQELNSAYIYSWVPRLVEGELCFEGDLVDLDEEDDDTNSILAERFMTGPVVERVNGVIVKTRNKTYVLEGQMALGVIESEEGVDTPHFIRHRFKSCVPENWEILVKQWIRVKALNIKNRQSMALIYESMRSYSSFAHSTSNVSDLPRRSSSSDESDISVCTTKLQKKKNLSMKKQSNIDILPCDEVESGDVKREDSPTNEDDGDVVHKKEPEIYDETKDNSPKKENVESFDESFSDGLDNQGDSKRRSDVLNPRRKRSTQEVDFGDPRHYCKSCNITFKNYRYHYESNYHCNVVEEQEKVPELVGPMDDYDQEMTYACEACKFSTDDITTIRRHTELYNHKMKISKRDKIVLFCNLCKFSCNANSKFYIHIGCKEHARRMVRLKQIKDSSSIEVLDVFLKRRAPRKKVTNQPLLATAAEEESRSQKSQSYNERDRKAALKESGSQVRRSYNEDERKKTLMVSAIEKERTGHASPSVFEDDSFDEDIF